MELNSEQNHNDYCLAYVFTDRDFDDGVLGLAWVGAPSGWYSSPNTHKPHKHKTLYCSDKFRLDVCLQVLIPNHPPEQYSIPSSVYKMM